MKNQSFLSLQEIYDRAAHHLYEQGGAALLNGGGGAYRSRCGGCPVGAFIRARDYKSSMEGIPVRHLLTPAQSRPPYMDAGVEALRDALLKARINANERQTVELLSCLQNVHDIFGIWEWRERLHSIAREFGLNVAAVARWHHFTPRIFPVKTQHADR